MTFYIKGIYIKWTQYFQLLYSIVIETGGTTCNAAMFLLIITRVRIRWQRLDLVRGVGSIFASRET